MGVSVGIPVAHTWNLLLPDYVVIDVGVAAGGGGGVFLAGGFLMVYRWFRR